MKYIRFLRIDGMKCIIIIPFALCVALITRVLSGRIFEGRRVIGFDRIAHDRAKSLTRRRTIALAAEALK